jgi:hypothetical protein
MGHGKDLGDAGYKAVAPYGADGVNVFCRVVNGMLVGRSQKRSYRPFGALCSRFFAAIIMAPLRGWNIIGLLVGRYKRPTIACSSQTRTSEEERCFPEFLIDFLRLGASLCGCPDAAITMQPAASVPYHSLCVPTS